MKVSEFKDKKLKEYHVPIYLQFAETVYLQYAEAADQVEHGHEQTTCQQNETEEACTDHQNSTGVCDLENKECSVSNISHSADNVRKQAHNSRKEIVEDQHLEILYPATTKYSKKELKDIARSTVRGLFDELQGQWNWPFILIGKVNATDRNGNAHLLKPLTQDVNKILDSKYFSVATRSSKSSIKQST